MRWIGMIAVVSVLFTAGCRQLGLDQHPFGRYGRPELVPVTEPREPVADFIQLNELARSLDLRLFDEHEDAVHWRDMQLFRVYEFSHYSVLIFPMNWNAGRFEITIVAGKLRDRTVSIRSLSPAMDRDDARVGSFYSFPPGFIASEARPNRVGLDGVNLYDSREKCETVFMPYFLQKGAAKREYYEKMWSLSNSMVAYSVSPGKCRYIFHSHDDGLQYMNLFCDYTRDPLLAHYGFEGASCNLVAEGTFSLKALLASGQLPPPAADAGTGP
jgi:hypothetical protein